MDVPGSFFFGSSGLQQAIMRARSPTRTPSNPCRRAPWDEFDGANGAPNGLGDFILDGRILSVSSSLATPVVFTSANRAFHLRLRGVREKAPGHGDDRGTFRSSPFDQLAESQRRVARRKLAEITPRARPASPRSQSLRRQRNARAVLFPVGWEAQKRPREGGSRGEFVLGGGRKTIIRRRSRRDGSGARARRPASPPTGRVHPWRRFGCRSTGRPGFRAPS